ncbi:hypothetical protein OVA24_16695 [Luteolibacter sp. SL250]|uniref:hypothetical protein n=1 Tax=Luteolibacter sp. SL250 TaxID=2995170 RepID=UPI00226D4BE8|nr:hypothetical protein [Luteolibacter sp. SL250]WAC18871.1 hypothetical protein OVA24_16695 [Luteolibacter sp. SL250]
MMALLILAATAAQHAPDPQISGKWILDVIPVAATALGGLIAAIIGAPVLKKRWKEEGRKEATEATVTLSGQPIHFQKTPAVVTVTDLKPLADRIGRLEDEVDDLRKNQADQFKQLLESGHERELRIIKEIKETASEWHRRLDPFVNPKPRSSR